MFTSGYTKRATRRSTALVAALTFTVGVPTLLSQQASAVTDTATTFLSDMTPSATPINGWGPYERDMSNGEAAAGDGRRITIGGTVFAKGLGVHATSDLRYTVPTGCALNAQIGVDDEAGSNGTVTFEVWDAATNTRLYHSSILNGTQGASPISVPLTGTALRLVVTDAGDGNRFDHADWADAKVTCPTSVTSTAVTSYVSDLPTSGTAVNGWGPFERDMSNGETLAGDGHPISVAGMHYSKGLGVHAGSALLFAIAANCTLSARVGIDDETSGRGSTQFEVWNGTSARLYQSPVKTGGQPATALSVPLTGVTSLRLVVTDGGDGNNSDHADWADAKVTCGSLSPPATVTSPAPAPATATSTPTATATATATAPTTTSPSFPAGPGVPAGAAFFGAGNYYHSLVASAPVDANSAAMISNLQGQVTSLYGGVAAFNAYQYNVSFFTAAAGTPRIDIKWSDCQNKGYLPPGLTEQWAQVPMPADAVVSPGTDKGITIYSPSLDKMWEFWVAEHRADGWYACWGGRMDNVSTTPNGYFLNGFGATATGLLNAAGAVSIADIKKGSIDHVVGINLYDPAMWSNFSWPAQRSDGSSSAASAMPEGTRLRLDPSINVDALPMTPIAKMIAKAAQKYGMVVVDRAGCVAVIAESGAAIRTATGIDPWAALMAGTPDYAILANFPWGKLQAVQRDWLKP